MNSSSIIGRTQLFLGERERSSSGFGPNFGVHFGDDRIDVQRRRSDVAFNEPHPHSSHQNGRTTRNITGHLRRLSNQDGRSSQTHSQKVTGNFKARISTRMVAHIQKVTDATDDTKVTDATELQMLQMAHFYSERLVM